MDRDSLLSLSRLPAVERRAVSDEELQEYMSRSTEQIKEAIADIRVGLFYHGIRATDFYHVKAKEVAFSREETKVLPRVRFDERYGIPVFSWEKLTRRVFPLPPNQRANSNWKRGTYIGYVKRKGHKSREKMKVTMTSTTVPLLKSTDSISPTTFSEEPAWAQYAGEEAERRLRALRKAEKLVTNINLRLAALKQLLHREGLE